MKPKIAVFGAGDYGQAIAADLTLTGYKVELLELSEFEEEITYIKRNGGIYLDGVETRSGKVGFAKLKVSTDIAEVLSSVDVIFVDVPVADCETRINAIAPYLRDGQILFFDSYGYWISLRVSRLLNQMKGSNIILSEGAAPIYSCSSNEGHVNIRRIRRKLPVAAFPSKKANEVIDVLKPIFPTFEIAKNVLQINFENINMIVHPGIALPNVGWFDRAEEKRARVDFYKTGNTTKTGTLLEAYDRERIPVCQTYEVLFTSMRKHIIDYYDSKGSSLFEVIQNCKLYQSRCWPADTWIKWIKTDVNYALIPYVALATLAGISTPISKGIIEVFGAILETNFWETGLTLDKLGLENLTREEIIRYVTEGTE